MRCRACETSSATNCWCRWGAAWSPRPRADSLQHAVRDMLVRLDSTITTEPSFDPSQSDRRFRIYASDYTQMVLAPEVMRLAAAAHCRASFDFLPQVANPQRHLERGDADLLVLPRTLMSDEHPSETLYEESFVCVLWAGSQLAKSRLTRDRYLAAGHVVMRPQATGEDSSFEDWFVRREGHQRRIAATSYGFATVPGLLVGTESVATMHARLASLLLGVWPLTLRPCPVAIPRMSQAVQWHSYRTHDPGLLWLRGLLQRAVAAMPPAVDVAAG